MTEIAAGLDWGEQQRHFAQIHSRLGHGIAVVMKRHPGFFQGRSGKLQLERSSSILRDLVEKWRAAFAERAQRKGLEILAWIAPELPTG